MRKLTNYELYIIIAIIITLLFGFLAKIYGNDWRYYINKSVEICTVSECYIGEVKDVYEFEICRQQDSLTHQCIYKEFYYTLFLQLSNKKIVLLNVEVINSIRELNNGK